MQMNQEKTNVNTVLFDQKRKLPKFTLAYKSYFLTCQKLKTCLVSPGAMSQKVQIASWQKNSDLAFL